MRVLLDTNIIIHREAARVYNRDIGSLFYWLDKLGYQKCIHPITVVELNRYADVKVVDTMNIKIKSYHQIKNTASIDEGFTKMCSTLDVTANDANDSLLLLELYRDRVDRLISEDKKIHAKAKLLGISDKVYSIDQFLERVTAENPQLIDYKVLSVRKCEFGKIDISDSFFDSFREDYQGFDKWFGKKADEVAYVCYHDGAIVAFLYIKVEDEKEVYVDIDPVFKRARRLKIGTFKVISNGFRLGERFLKIVFDNALKCKVDEVYVTLFEKRPEQLRLIAMLEEWGFMYHGGKTTENGLEKVLVKSYNKNQAVNVNSPKLTFPFVSDQSKCYIVSIYPEYHTELFPDSILRTESPLDFTESEPHRNALSKVYVSRSHFRDLKSGDLIVFYRTGGYYKGVATTYGIVESVINDIPDLDTFMKACKKRSVYSDQELIAQWQYSKVKPFVVNFIYAYSFKKRPNLQWLHETGIIPDINNMPRGFSEITRDEFKAIAKYSVGK